MGLKCIHIRVEISVDISDETSFFLEKIKNLGQNLGAYCLFGIRGHKIFADFGKTAKIKFCEILYPRR